MEHFSIQIGQIDATSAEVTGSKTAGEFALGSSFLI